MGKIIVIFITLILILICLLIVSINPSLFKVFIVPEIISILSPLIALANLLIVVHTFKYNSKQTKITESISKKAHWYRNVVLDRYLNFLMEKFDKLITDIELISEDKCSDQGLIEAIQEFANVKIDIIDRLNDLIRIMNSEFAETLDDQLYDLEDYYTLEIEDLLTSSNNDWDIKKSEIKERIISTKNKYIELLYAFEMNNYSA